MSINGTARKVKSSFLVVPNVSGMSNKKAAHAYLDAGLMPHPWRVGFKHGVRTKRSCYGDFSFSDINETHKDIDKWMSGWQCGLVTAPSSGLIAIDIDYLDKFEAWDFMEFPETAQAMTGHEGGYHLLYDARDLPARDWPKQGDIPGGQVKSAGFIGAEPAIHPNGRPYRWGRNLRTLAPIGALGNAVAKYRHSMNGTGGANGTGETRRGPEKTSGLWSRVLSAGNGQQHDALRDWVWDAKMRGLEDEEILDRLEYAVDRGQVKSFRRDSWSRAGFRELLPAPGRAPVPAARADELAGSFEPRVAIEDEDAFWASRPVLGHIRDWARARYASPWATLGEAIAEAVCHTPPTLQLPGLVGGEGTLNMLIALVGKPGAGKNAAAQAARAAFTWHGVMGLTPDKVVRTPLGSGEGIAKNFGFTFTNKETKRTEMGRTEYTSIVTIPEIDTFAAIRDRSGSTLSPELRKFYSGEDLGFGWSDPSKRVIIPAHEYRGCVIAGVQPGKGAAILSDMDGGFAQRWVWFSANDPYAVDIDYNDPDVWDWSPPASCGEDKFVMKVCDIALREMRAKRVMELHDLGEDIDSHSMYTRLKVAAGLALLDERDSVEESDWDMSLIVMEKSNDCRDSVAAHLRRKEFESNIARGRAEGVRAEVAVTTQHQQTMKRIAGNVRKKMPPKHAWISVSDIKNSIAPRDRVHLEDVLIWLVDNGTLERMDSEYHSQKTVKYRKAVKLLSLVR